MALIECTCGQRISSRAKACPKCGEQQRAAEAPSAAEAVPSAAPPEPALAEAPAEGRIAEAAPATYPEAHHSGAPAGRKRLGFFRKKKGKEEEALQSPAPQPVAEWYYIAGAGRGGPVDLPTLKMMVAQGHFTPELPVWKAGMPDWVKLSEYEEEMAEESAPEGESRPARNGLAWALALAPLWGAAVQLLATEVRIAVTHHTPSFYASMWWLIVAFNLLLSYLDLRRVTGGGERADLGRWLWLFPPLYLYRRDRSVGANSTRLTLWTGSCIVATVALFLLNGMYTPLAR